MPDSGPANRRGRFLSGLRYHRPVPAQRTINASLSPDGLTLAVDSDFGALALREARRLALAAACAPVALATAVFAPSLPVAHPALVGLAVGAGLVLCGAALAPLARFWPGRSLRRRAHDRFASAVEQGEPPNVALALACDLAFATGLARTARFVFDAPAWRGACARAGIAPPVAIFLASDLANARDSRSGFDFDSLEPVDLTANATPSAGLPGCLPWLVALGLCVVILFVLAGAGATHLLTGLSVGAAPLGLLVARRVLTTSAAESVVASPGRLRWTTKHATRDLPREEITLVIERSGGGLRVTAWPDSGAPLTLHFRTHEEDGYARLVRLLLSPTGPT